jgi:hypothetical protein
MPFFAPPAAVSSVNAPLTRDQEHVAFVHGLYLLGIVDDDGNPNESNPIYLMIKREGFAEIGDLTSMNHASVDALTFQDEGTDEDGDTILLPVAHLPAGYVQRLKIFIQCINYWSTHLGSMVDILTIDRPHFNDWRMFGYQDEWPLQVPITGIPTGPIEAGGTVVAGGGHHGGGPHVGGGAGPPPVHLHGGNPFNRGIKKTKDDYPEFKDEKYWDNFRRTVEITADTHETQDVLNAAFVPDPTDTYAVNIFRAKNRFMYSVFDAKIKTNKGIAIVRSHEVDRDAQAVWKELSTYQTTSTSGVLARGELLGFLTTFKLSPTTWKGSYNGFLVNYQDKLREHERLAPVSHHFADDVKVSFIQAAVSQVKELDLVKTQVQLSVAIGNTAPNFLGYMTLLASAAATLDAAQANRPRTPRPMGSTGDAVIKPTNTNVIANIHDCGNDPDEDDWDPYDERHQFYDDDDNLHTIDTSEKEPRLYLN